MGAECLRGEDYRNNPALIQDGLGLLVAGDWIDLVLTEVRNAIVAAAVLATSGNLARPDPAADYLEAVSRYRFSEMERAVISVHRKWNDGPSSGIR